MRFSRVEEAVLLFALVRGEGLGAGTAPTQPAGVSELGGAWGLFFGIERLCRQRVKFGV